MTEIVYRVNTPATNSFCCPFWIGDKKAGDPKRGECAHGSVVGTIGWNNQGGKPMYCQSNYVPDGCPMSGGKVTIHFDKKEVKR